MPKKRLDVLLTEHALAPSRERAKTMIMEGIVFVNGQREDKPGTGFDPEKIKTLEVRGDSMPYVSRGGLKLEQAVTQWDLSFDSLVCIDIGASTGGFTDLMLQRGAARVYAIDSGVNQLDYRLRTDPRVVSMEQTNFRYLTVNDLPEQGDFATADVSFISLAKIFPAAFPLLKEGAKMVCLVKPQFEAGREQVGKKGIVRDKKVHAAVLQQVMESAVQCGFAVLDHTESPIQGRGGNTEFLMLLQKPQSEKDTGT